MPGFFNKYPYTDFHELNLDYILEQMKLLRKAFEDFVGINTITFADPILWSITREYGKNVVVLDNSGNAYLSLQIIPAGIPLTNADYWMEIFNFTGFISAINSNITFNIENNTDIATANYAVDDWILIDNILYHVTAAISIGDTFEEGTNITRFTLEQFIKSWVTSCTQLINQYKDDIDASELAFTTSLQAAFNAAVGAVTVDSEVVLARKGWNGYTYPTLADAIQGQLTEIGGKFEYDLDTANWVSNNAINYSTGGPVTVSGYSRSGQIVLKPGTTELTVYSSNTNPQYGIAFYNNYVFISGVTLTSTIPADILKTVVSVPSGASTFRLCCVTSKMTDLHVIDTTPQLPILDREYLKKTVIDKPYSMDDANVIVFGDSLMVGYLPDSTIAASPWINQLATKANFSNLRNEAVGGAGYHTGANVYNQMQGIDFSQRDFIIIAAGTNDYYYNVPLNTFEADLVSTYDYVDLVNTNNSKVIIITPVPRSAAQQYTGDSLDTYRELITKHALMRGYSVIDGTDAPFNTELDSYQTAVMSDGLHPTQLGYNLYANWIAGLLL